MTSSSSNTVTTSTRLFGLFFICGLISFSKATTPNSKLRGASVGDNTNSAKRSVLLRRETTTSRRQLGFLNKDCTTIAKKKKRKLCKKKQKKAAEKAAEEAEKAAEEAEVAGKTGDDNGGGGGALPVETTDTPTSSPTSKPISSPTSTPTFSPTFEPTFEPSKSPVGAPSPPDCGEIPPVPNPMGPNGKGGGGGGGGKGTWVWLPEFCVWFKYSSPRGGVGSTDDSCTRDLSTPATNVNGQTSYFPCPVPADERTSSGLEPTSTCQDSHDCETGCCMRAGIVSPTAIVQANLCLYHEAQGSFNQCIYDTTDEGTTGRSGSTGGLGNPLGGGGDDTSGGGSGQNPGGKWDGEPCETSSECLDDCCADVGPPFGIACVATFGFASDRCIRT